MNKSLSSRVQWATLLLMLLSSSVAMPQSLRQQLEAGAEIRLHREDAVRQFYLERQFAPFWFDTRDQQWRAKPAVSALAAEIAGIAAEGLNPADYHGAIWADMDWQRGFTQAEASTLEMRLTDAWLTLADHLQSGKVDPTSVSDNWQAKPRRGDALRMLAEIKGADSVKATLNKLRPASSRYQRLKDQLAKYRQLAGRPWPAIANGETIKPGMNDLRLAAITDRLLVLGDLRESAHSETYQEPLLSAVKAFQLRHGLDGDGAIGSKTLTALNVSPKVRAEQLRVNLERWRWLAEDLGKKHVLVNIAAFEMKVIEDGETVLRKPVVVGRNYRKTPVFSDLIRYIVFNPTWTVPYSIATKDKLPDFRKNPGLVNSQGFKVYQSATGAEVDAAKINWNSITASNFPYRLVQSPGPKNALGQMKFMFPNSFDVYLHDTPSRELFSKSERAFSSGCVRVAQPSELALNLLSPQGWDQMRLSKVLDGAKMEVVHLKNPVPVHIEYWTAWVERDGSLHFRNDIYERDKPLLQALEKTR